MQLLVLTRMPLDASPSTTPVPTIRKDAVGVGADVGAEVIGIRMKTFKPHVVTLYEIPEL
tara:strand:- start:321 stop:500 length:180 start_codon:yes stop_codon:yes gene_type:complete